MTFSNLKFFGNKSILKTLVDNSFKAIDNGSYEIKTGVDFSSHATIDLGKNLSNCRHVPLITELKFSSPSKGTILDTNSVNLETTVTEMEIAHSSGVSILTQPFLFNGSIDHILKVRKKTTMPILMKDIIVSEIQINTAKKIGADCILFIKTIFDRNMTEGSLEKLGEYAKKLGLQVIIETHSKEEFEDAIKLNRKSDRLFDIIGINNRNLDTLKIDLDTTKQILQSCDKENNLILSESGIYSKKDIIYLKEFGADAFLVGTSLMENIDNLGREINKLYLAY
ncbi:MAG: indole-3-glycerol-phosphate synthase [Nitrosopumilus sp.]|nr:indole-3-glycerol-phosphate synthase [Nitrosopumilus sp.]